MSRSVRSRGRVVANSLSAFEDMPSNGVDDYGNEGEERDVSTSEGWKRTINTTELELPDLFTSDGVLKGVGILPSVRWCMASLWSALGEEMNASDTFKYMRPLGFKYRTITSNIVAARRVLADVKDNTVSLKKPRSSSSFVELSPTLLQKLKDPSSKPETVTNCIHESVCRNLGDSGKVLTSSMNFYHRCSNLSKALQHHDWFDMKTMLTHVVFNDMDDVRQHQENFLMLWDIIDGDVIMKNKILYGALAYLFPREVRDCNIRNEGVRGRNFKGWVRDYWNPDSNGKPTIMFGKGDMRRNYERYIVEVENAGWNKLKISAQKHWTMYTDNDLKDSLSMLWLKTLPMMHDFAKTKKRTKGRSKVDPVVDDEDISVSVTFDSSNLQMGNTNVILKTQKNGSFRLHLGDLMFSRAPVAIAYTL